MNALTLPPAHLMVALWNMYLLIAKSPFALCISNYNFTNSVQRRGLALNSLRLRDFDKSAALELGSYFYVGDKQIQYK